MFRAQQNAFDDAVAKATDENLTSENWEWILDVCDRANGEESGPKDVVSAMIKRLAHRNANVQLYTLELANSLSQNCGVKVHRELASRSFTDALLRLAADRNTHQQVKAKILERMAEWVEMFSKDPDLGVMEQAYMKLKTQNPNLQPPSKPTKRQITEADRQKEEDELQMALELSVKDKQTSASSQAQRASQNAQPSTSNNQAVAPAQPMSSGTTAATVSRVRALFDFQPSEPGELQFKKGDIIAVLESVYKDWWKGSLRGQTGIFPLNYVEKLSDPTQEELQREAQMEAEVFAEIKNVEKLLTLLSTSNTDMNVRDNEEITTLYHSTLAIRPKLIELIGKYSQRKDDFTQLNEKFIKARRDYESLLEASMSQPSQPAYGRPGHASYAYGGGYPSQPSNPAQHDPTRYYSPNPHDSRTPQPQHPPQNGPQPFHMTSTAGASQTPQPAYPAPTSYPNSSDPRNNRTASGTTQQAPPSTADPYHHHRPQSTYDHPQELGTSYHSPTERPTSYPPTSQFAPHMQQQQQQPQPQQGQPDYSPSVYSPDDTAEPGSGPGGGAQQAHHQPSAPPAQFAPYAPASAGQPPYGQAPPGHAQVGYPGKPSSPGLGYVGLHGREQGDQAQGHGQPAYQAYHPPKESFVGGGGGGNPSDYYR